MITVRLIYGEYTMNVVSEYAPQTGSTNEEKKEFWRKQENEMEIIAVEEIVVVDIDLNGHVGTDKDTIERMHEGHELGNVNADSERILGLAISFDLAIANTFSYKREEHIITYKNGGNSTQIDNHMYRRSNLAEIKDCKVIPGNHVASQHHLLVMDV